MTELLALGGEADLVIRGQVFGRCIRHALSGLPSSVIAIVIPMIEPPLGTLLVAPARSTPLLGPYEHRT